MFHDVTGYVEEAALVLQRDERFLRAVLANRRWTQGAGRSSDDDDDSVNKMEFRECQFMSRMSHSCCVEVFVPLVSH